MRKPFGSVFVGRRCELDTLTAALAPGRTGPRWAAVGGEAGIGKSRLVTEFTLEARRAGWDVLTGACGPLVGATPSLGPILDAVQPRLPAGRVVGDDLVGGLGAPGAVARPEYLFAVLRDICTTTPVDAVGTVLVVEDLHWADQASVDFLAFLAAARHEQPILVVLTYRHDELPHEHASRALLAELTRLGATLIELTGLTRAETTELGYALSGVPRSDEASTRLYVRSSGVPFLVEELLSAELTGPADPCAGDIPVPQRLTDLMLARVHRVDAPTRQLLRVLAVAGHGVGHQLAVAASELTETRFCELVEQAVQHHLIEIGPANSYWFRHALIREVVDAHTLPGERVRIHHAYAAALSSGVGAARMSAAGRSAELAHHWYEAGEVEHALPACIDVALASESTSPGEARRHFERALRMWPDAHACVRDRLDLVGLYEHLAATAHAESDHDTAATYIRTALDLVDPVTEPARMALAHERLGRYLWAAGDREAAAMTHYTLALEIAPPDDLHCQATVLAAHAQQLMVLGRFEECQTVSDKAIEIAHAVGDDRIEAHALCTKSTGQAWVGDVGPAVPGLERAVLLAHKHRDHRTIVRASGNLSAVLLMAGRPADATRVAMDSITQSRRFGLEHTEGQSAVTNLVGALFWAGRWDQAEDVLREYRGNGYAGTRCLIATNAAELDIARGRLDTAATALGTARDALPETGYALHREQLLVVQTELAIWSGTYLDALRSVVNALERTAPNGHAANGARLMAVGMRACADHTIGNRLDGVPERDEDAALRTRLGEHLTATLANHRRCPYLDTYLALAVAERTRLGPIPDVAAWERAEQSAERAGNPYLAVYCRWRRAEAMTSGDDTEPGALELVEQALVTTDRLGAAMLHTRVHLLADRLRARVREPHGGPLASLTPREFEVLALISEGETNRGVGQRLTISVKTVSIHVSRILAKLGVANRGQAAAIAYQAGLVPAAGPVVNR